MEIGNIHCMLSIQVVLVKYCVNIIFLLILDIWILQCKFYIIYYKYNNVQFTSSEYLLEKIYDADAGVVGSLTTSSSRLRAASGHAN